jgi:NAD(P)-dependent dehydrogenase (short-subunit alcohol dehydrogenase family)
VAIITGAGSGIGRGTANILASRGARIVVADIDGARAAVVAGEIRAAGGEAVEVTVDVAEEGQVKAMVEAAMDVFGRLDVLDNNAAITSGDHFSGDVDVVRMDVDVWDRTMAVNVRGQMLSCKHAVPAMIADGGGSIILTSSGSALHGSMSGTAYGTSKAAILGLNKYVAAQYGRDGVRCNALIPSAASPEGRPPNLPDRVLKGVATLNLNLLGRRGTPDDIGRAVAFLASDDASWITGEVLYVNGGAKALQPWWGFSREAYEEEIAAAHNS